MTTSSWRARPAVVVLALLAANALAAADTTALDPLPAQRALFGRALGALGVDARDARLDAAAIAQWGGDRYLPPPIALLRDDPWRTSAWARTFSSQLLGLVGDPMRLATAMQDKLGRGVRTGLVFDPLRDEKAAVDRDGDGALAAALAAVTGRPAAEFRTAEHDRVPPEIREAAALLLRASLRADGYRRRALVPAVEALARPAPEELRAEVLDAALETLAEGGKDDEWLVDPDRVRLLETLGDHVDWGYLNTGATIVAAAAKEALAIAREAPAGARFRFRAETPAGPVVLAGSGDDDHGGEACALLIDAGGDDRYSGGGASAPGVPIGVLLDLGGDDRYVAPGSDPAKPAEAPVAAFGAGVFGYGVLLDAAGNDVYEGAYLTQGCGLFGTGALWDGGGDDRYRALAYGQGGGSFGTGLLSDAAGNDDYGIYKYGQGFGFTLGAGLLIDASGDDRYAGLEEGHANGGPYGEGRHVAFVQGAGEGRRADYLDGHSWAGGVGVLVDGAGDDSYRADTYGMGAAYWHAFGMIVDKAGDDRYAAVQYSMGSSPHFGAGIFQDEAGDDAHDLSLRQGIGHGRDWALAWFEDVAGDDSYRAPGSAIGDSHVNALSVFWERAGDDTYVAAFPALGESERESSGTMRDWLPTLALFVDGGGRDRYLAWPLDDKGKPSPALPDPGACKPLAGVGDGRAWVRTPAKAPSPGYRGAGVDGESAGKGGSR